MQLIDYSSASVPVRPDLVTSHEDLLGHLSQSGTWWSGAERRAIAEAARAARSCRLCAERKAALSPFSVDGVHDGPDELGPAVVDVIHRVVTDPGRLSKSWYERVMASGALDPDRFVELVSVTVFITAMDVFARAVGVEHATLPAASDAPPSGLRPAGAAVDRAWVPQLKPGSDSAEQWLRLYGERDQVAEVERALSLVPAEVEMLNRVADAHYVAFRHVPDPTYTHPERALDRAQTELIAARVSAINGCFY